MHWPDPSYSISSDMVNAHRRCLNAYHIDVKSRHHTRTRGHCICKDCYRPLDRWHIGRGREKGICLASSDKYSRQEHRNLPCRLYIVLFQTIARKSLYQEKKILNRPGPDLNRRKCKKFPESGMKVSFHSTLHLGRDPHFSYSQTDCRRTKFWPLSLAGQPIRNCWLKVLLLFQIYMLDQRKLGLLACCLLRSKCCTL